MSDAALTAVRSEPQAKRELTARLAELALTTTTASLSAEVIDATKQVIVDTLACAIGAAETEVGRLLISWKRDQGGIAQSTLVVDGTQVPMSAAANVNSQLANLLDADETLHNFTHFASTIVMPVLAAGEAGGAAGADVIAAVATGYDIAARIGLAIPDYEVDDAGNLVRFPGSGFSWAAFGTAAAVGRLLGLTEPQLRHAFGVAFVTTPVHGCLVSYVSTMGKNSSPWHKYAMYGTIAEAGVNAALLAHGGFAADPCVLDRGSEFWRSFGGSGFDWDVVEGGLGQHWYIAETSLKPYPFCRYGNGPLDLFRQIMDQHHLTETEIDDVTVTVVPFEPIRTLVEARYPATGLDVMSSVPYALSMVAAGVPAGPQWWSEEHLHDPSRARFQEKVAVQVRADWHDVLVDQIATVGRFRRLPVTVEVTAGDRSFSASSEYAKGDPGPETRFTWDELADKVGRFVADALPAGASEEIIALGQALDRGNRDVGALMRVARRAPTA